MTASFHQLLNSQISLFCQDRAKTGQLNTRINSNSRQGSASTRAVLLQT